MFYSNFKKIIAGTLITACTISYIPATTAFAVAPSYNITACSVSNNDMDAGTKNDTTVTTTGSATDAPATSGSSIDTPVTPAALSVSVPKKVSLYPNEQKKLKVTVKNNSTKVKKNFKSKKPSIVKVNSNGKMTAKKAGTTTIITKITVNGKKYTKKTKVTVINAYLVFTNATVMLNRGQTFQFKIKKYNIKKPVTWSVNNSKIATIGKKTGKLRGKSRGSVLVTATCGSLQKSIYVSIR